MSTSPFRLKRDKDGNLEPIEGKTPNFGHPVKVLPLTYGEARGLDSFGEDLSSWSLEDRFYIVSEHIVEPEIGAKDPIDMADNYDPFTIEDFFQAVFLYSGIFRLFEAGGEQGNE